MDRFESLRILIVPLAPSISLGSTTKATQILASGAGLRALTEKDDSQLPTPKNSSTACSSVVFL